MRTKRQAERERARLHAQLNGCASPLFAGRWHVTARWIKKIGWCGVAQFDGVLFVRYGDDNLRTLSARLGFGSADWIGPYADVEAAVIGVLENVSNHSLEAMRP